MRLIPEFLGSLIGLGKPTDGRIVAVPQLAGGHPRIDDRTMTSEFHDLGIGFQDGLQLEFDP